MEEIYVHIVFKCFPWKARCCLVEQVCQGVKCEAPRAPGVWVFHCQNLPFTYIHRWDLTVKACH